MSRLIIPLVALAWSLSPVTGQDREELDDNQKAAEESTSPPENSARSVEELAKLARRSAVVIRHGGRSGGEGGTGSGFVISDKGLVATCAHVIGESRPLTVHFDDGSEHKVTSIHAWDAKLDLAAEMFAETTRRPRWYGEGVSSHSLGSLSAMVNDSRDWSECFDSDDCAPACHGEARRSARNLGERSP